GIDSHTTDLILKSRDRIGDAFRHSKAVAESFLNILNSKNAFDTLQEMHRLRVLGRYIPEFQEVTYRMQHDLYHIYTVDIHSLFAVREVEMLTTDYREHFPNLSALYSETDRHHILKLAILLHDIGKSHGRGHAAKGALIALDICSRLGLSEEDIHLVIFLVRHHLILADSAQHRDLHDDKFIIDFARTVGDRRRLNLLYLLTFADVRAVGPDVWTRWKETLFQELYTKTLMIIERGSFSLEDSLKRLPSIEEEVKRRLQDVVKRGVTHDFFKFFPTHYFLTNEPDVIAEHFTIISELRGKSLVMRVKQNPERNYTEITLCAEDIPGLFSRIAGIMAAHSINILGAQIYSLKNGAILDVLQVNSTMGRMITSESKWLSVEQDMEKILTDRISIESLVAKRAPSILEQTAKPRIRTSVAIDNVVSDTFTVIDIHTEDRIGLLYQIARILSNLGLFISIAKISTKGGAATDIFYVWDNSNRKVVKEETLREIKERLFEALAEGLPEEVTA
ncbi:MAG: HD domain-containing protein, partial [Thermodesulfobacteriota bacterium]